MQLPLWAVLLGAVALSLLAVVAFAAAVGFEVRIRRVPMKTSDIPWMRREPMPDKPEPKAPAPAPKAPAPSLRPVSEAATAEAQALLAEYEAARTSGNKDGAAAAKKGLADLGFAV